MHLKYISKNFKNSLFEQMYDDHPEYKDKKYINILTKRRHKRSSREKRRRRHSSSESDCK
jgi:splicing factor U2AF subunit